MTKAWNVLQGVCLPHSLCEPNPPLLSVPPSSPSIWRMFLLGNWFKGAIDKKEWNIKLTSQRSTQVGKSGVGGQEEFESIVLRTPQKGGLISLSSPFLFSHFLFFFPLTPPPSVFFFIHLYLSACVHVCFLIVVWEKRTKPEVQVLQMVCFPKLDCEAS